MNCQVCGARAPTHKVFFVQHIGAIIMFFHKRIGGKLCRNCVDKYFSEYFGTTLLLGWWGPISFFVTPFVLLIDIVNYVPAVVSLRTGKWAASTSTARTSAPRAPTPPVPASRPAQEPRAANVATAVRGFVACPAPKCQKRLRVGPDVHGQVQCRECGHVFTCRNQARVIKQAISVAIIALLGGFLFWLRHSPAPPQVIR